jgi:hypothetical protein
MVPAAAEETLPAILEEEGRAGEAARLLDPTKPTLQYDTTTTAAGGEVRCPRMGMDQGAQHVIVTEGDGLGGTAVVVTEGDGLGGTACGSY